MRGAGIGGIFSFQTYANLVRLSEEFADRMVGSCETRTFFALGDSTSRDFAAALIGETLKDFKSYSQSIGASKGNTNLDVELFHKTSESTGESSGSQERYDFAVRPEEFRDLGLGEAIVAPMQSKRAFNIKFPLFDPISVVKYEKRDIPTPDVVGLNLQAIFEQELALG